jgi:hypothetical protein
MKGGGRLRKDPMAISGNAIFSFTFYAFRIEVSGWRMDRLEGRFIKGKCGEIDL